MLRPVTIADAAAIAAIYNHFVTDTIVTFDEEALPPEEMARRIDQTIGEGFPWLVWEEGGRVLGYAYAGRWKSRCSYRHSAEATVYLDHTATGRGIGTQLYAAVIAALKAMGVHAVIGGVALPNPASEALHNKLGFRKVAHFKEVGCKFNQWIDVGYWELLL